VRYGLPVEWRSCKQLCHYGNLLTVVGVAGEQVTDNDKCSKLSTSCDVRLLWK